MNIIDDKEINNKVFELFYKNIIKQFKNNEIFQKELRNIYIQYIAFNLQNVYQLDDFTIIEELKYQMKIHFIFFNSEDENIFNDNFKMLPLYTKLLILKLLLNKGFKFEIEDYVIEETKKRINIYKDKLYKNIITFTNGNTNVPLQLISFIKLLEFQSFDKNNDEDILIVNFIDKFLKQKLVKNEIINHYSYEFFEYIKDLFYSSDIYKSFVNKLQNNIIQDRIDSLTLQFILNPEPSEDEEQVEKGIFPNKEEEEDKENPFINNDSSEEEEEEEIKEKISLKG